MWAARAVDTLRTVSGSPPPSAAIVSALRWKNGSGALHTTIVAKLTMQLREDGRAALVQPEPFVAFDRLGSDPRHVAEASELMPWTTVASVVAYGGPLRFSLAREAAGRAPFSVELPELPHAGLSMSSPERAAFAPHRPTRGADGVLTIADDIDGRYFVAAAKASQLPSVRGDELFALEVTGWSTERALPGMAVEAALQLGPQRRVVTLTTDMIVVHVVTRRISLVSRALVNGDAALVAHALCRVGRGTTSDHGDARQTGGTPREQATSMLAPGEALESFGAADETSDVSAADLAALAAPFQLEPPSARSSQLGGARLLPATPFDPGFVAQPVQPGVGVLATLSPDEELAQQLDRMRRQMRAQPAAVASPPPTSPTARPDAQAQVAPPKPGAMAKPRFKRR